MDKKNENNEVATGRLVYLSVDEIYPHPDNPRKDLGDLTELAESIKANGVLQNLTVVPLKSKLKPEMKLAGYTVIIGHRRHAAAKLAGLTELPCIIADMSEREQLSTMLTENMQRSDLTVYEQAQGFQMMLDLGDTVEQIAQKAGFSRSTVYRRVKLLELDGDKFKKAADRGATLQDYMELDKIEDPALKNQVLDAIGTANFRNVLKSAIEKEEVARRMREWQNDLVKFATQIEKRDYIGEEYHPMESVKTYGWWAPDSLEVHVPEDLGTVRYYFLAGKDKIEVYRDRQAAPEETAEERQKKTLAAAWEERKADLEEASHRHFSLRMDFIRDFTDAKKRLPEIIRMATAEMIGESRYGGCRANPDVLGRLFDIADDDWEDYDQFKQIMEETAKETTVEYFLLACTYADLEDENKKYWRSTWNTENRMWETKHLADGKLDLLYDFLRSLGYEMSDEELAMQNGTHPLFAPVEVVT